VKGFIWRAFQETPWIALTQASERARFRLSVGKLVIFGALFIRDFPRPSVRAGRGSSQDTAWFIHEPLTGKRLSRPPKILRHASRWAEMAKRTLRRTTPG
jgi:hypothetical protein